MVIKIDGDSGVYTKISNLNDKLDIFEDSLIDLSSKIDDYKAKLTGESYQSFFSTLGSNIDSQKTNIAKYRVLLADANNYVNDMENAESGVSFN